MFAPSDDSMHVIKLNYNHLLFQRTQIYGNLWYDESTAVFPSSFEDLQGDHIDADKLRSDKRKLHEKKVKKSFFSSVFNFRKGK